VSNAGGYEIETMLYYHELNRDNSPGPIIPRTSASRYAWLEHAQGNWHFLTSLFADVQESTRRWTSKQRALDELIKEGWTVIGAYPESPSMQKKAEGEALGYGLLWTGH
jgi:hypothetical protein